MICIGVFVCMSVVRYVCTSFSGFSRKKFVKVFCFVDVKGFFGSVLSVLLLYVFLGFRIGVFVDGVNVVMCC